MNDDILCLGMQKEKTRHDVTKDYVDAPDVATKSHKK